MPPEALEPAIADHDRDRGPLLLAIAREALATEAILAACESRGWLVEHGASFVTLRIESELRGCIGTIDPRRPLGHDVMHNARAAAYRDPRFPPVSAFELPRLAIEVSVLSPREPLPACGEAEALAQLRPGVDGIYLEYDGRTSTFLPQVWTSLPDPRDFLGDLKRKAGLPHDFWHAALRLSRYTVAKYR